MIINTKITRDPEDGTSKGHGFVSFDNFVSADLAVQQMNGQYFSGRQIRVEYAVKKDTKGEKHGGFAERLLAENKPKNANKMPAIVYNQAPTSVPLDALKQQTPSIGDLPFAKGGIKPSQLPPPKPLLMKPMPEIKLPPMPLPPQPK